MVLLLLYSCKTEVDGSSLFALDKSEVTSSHVVMDVGTGSSRREEGSLFSDSNTLPCGPR